MNKRTRKDYYKIEKEETLNDTELLFDGQKLIIDGFKRKEFFNNKEVSQGYEDPMVSNLNGKDQSESEPNSTDMPVCKVKNPPLKEKIKVDKDLNY